MRHIAYRAGVTIVAVVAILAGILAITPAASAEDSYRITIDMAECDVMAVGVIGTCIISLQTWLNIFEKAGLVVDGKFGPATEAAVKNFQRNHGLDPDGRFGNFSRNALRGEYQDMMANSVPSPKPAPLCNTATGEGCDLGEAVPGLNGGIIQTLFCEGIDRRLGIGVFCDVVLE
jgi:peptidoglycan hydrolase-like protein with peptidoglycan-binding domain